MPSCFLPASITLHQGDFGSRRRRSRGLQDLLGQLRLTFIVTDPPSLGSVRVLDREARRPSCSISPPTAPRRKVRSSRHRHPGAVLEDVIDGRGRQRLRSKGRAA
jgi:hypothetical protein